jgi:hypothetical protein
MLASSLCTLPFKQLPFVTTLPTLLYSYPHILELQKTIISEIKKVIQKNKKKRTTIFYGKLNLPSHILKSQGKKIIKIGIHISSP